MQDVALPAEQLHALGNVEVSIGIERRKRRIVEPGLDAEHARIVLRHHAEIRVQYPAAEREMRGDVLLHGDVPARLGRADVVGAEKERRLTVRQQKRVDVALRALRTGLQQRLRDRVGVIGARDRSDESESRVGFSQPLRCGS